MSFGSKGSPSGTFFDGGLVRRSSWPLGSSEGGTIRPRPRAGVVLCFVSAVGSGAGSCGVSGALLERGAKTCDVCLLLLLAVFHDPVTEACFGVGKMSLICSSS